LSERPPLYPKGKVWDVQAVVDAYRVMLAGGQLMDLPPGNAIVRAAMVELVGKNLACWCPLTYPDGTEYPCHATVLLSYTRAAV
jgi:hypothetical protein